MGWPFFDYVIPKGYLWEKIEELAEINLCQSDFILPRQMAVINKILNAVFAGQIDAGNMNALPTFDFSAGGGTVQKGMPTVVGERGPEIFIPHSGGTIMNNMNSRNAMGGNPIVVNQSINFATGVVPTVRAEVMKLMPQIADVTKGAVAESAMRGGNFRRALQGG